MTGSIRIGVVMAVACCLLLHASYGFSESIEDGYITRSDASVCLKNGNVVQCGNILWLTQAADYLQCDQGGTCREIKIDDVDVEKTFGSKIAREYEASKAQLENAVAREKEKMRENVVSYENNPSGSAGEDGPSDASDETTGTEGAARDSSQASGATQKKQGPFKVKLTPERERELRAQLKRCRAELKKVKAMDHDKIPYRDQILQAKNGIVDMPPEEYWRRRIRDAEARCHRIERRLEGYIVGEPRSVKVY